MDESHHLNGAAHLANHREQFERYAACAEIFSLQQWSAIQLRYAEGLNQEEIALRLGVSRSAVSNRLCRAKRVFFEHQRALRREQFETWRRSQEKSEF